MYYPVMNEDNNTRSMIDTWRGYNHNYRIADGEFYDMENMSSDGYPVLIPRNKRVVLRNKMDVSIPETDRYELDIKGMIYTEDTLCYINRKLISSVTTTDEETGEETTTNTYNCYLYLSKGEGEQEVNLGDFIYDQTILRFGAYLLIYPLNKAVNFYDYTIVDMNEKYTTPDAGITITARLSKADGSEYGNVTVSETAPENPATGSYWLCTKSNAQGLNIYQTDSWTPIATTYIRLEFPNSNMTSHFEVGDTLYMNLNGMQGVDVGLINNGSIVQAIGSDYIVVLGLMTRVNSSYTTTSGTKVTIERRMPTLDYVCCDKNRVWGCRYGYNNTTGKLVNEIYCTKLGDFRNWFNYAGLSTDSYAVSVGVSGKWTGCISYGGYPTFFKENAIFRIYGSYPAEYVVNQVDARGVQDGSYRSLAIIGEYLYYKAAGGVVVWDGSTPTMISSPLGKNAYYYQGVAGVVDNKYHLRVENQVGGSRYFVYDSENNIWTQEDPLSVKWFSWDLSGRLCAATSNKIYGLGSTDSIEYANKLVGEEYVKWYAETGELGFNTPDFKYVSRITLRAYIPTRSEIQVQISYDDRDWEDVGILRGNDEIMSQNLSIYPFRCDRYRLKFSGHGAVRIYSLATTLETGSEERGNTY